MRELVTTFLDTLGLLLLAAGAVGALWAYAGPGSLVVGGAVVLVGSWLASRGPKPRYGADS